MQFLNRSLMLCLALFTVSCSQPLAHVELATPKPQQKETPYTVALDRFGELVEVYRYGAGEYCVAALPFIDKTGTHNHSGGEIPSDVTDMVKSAVNRVGGGIRFVVSDTDYVLQQQSIGVTLGVTLPNVVIDGGITEFDRALESHAGRANGGGGFDSAGVPVDFEGNSAMSNTVSRITVDVNLIQYKTQKYIPKLQATNSIEVYKGTNEYDVGFAIYGFGIGGGASTKKLQGRHEALRLLVDLSVLELLGRQLQVPYWRVLGDDFPRDPYVVLKRKRHYLRKGSVERVSAIQEWLIYNGYHDVRPSGEFDAATESAMSDFIHKQNLSLDIAMEELYAELCFNVPIDLSLMEQSDTLIASYKAKNIQLASTPAQNVMKVTVTQPSKSMINSKTRPKKQVVKKNEDFDSEWDAFEEFIEN